MADAVAGDILRWMMFVVVMQTLAVFSDNNHGDPADDDHHHHSATNVWTNTRNHDFVRPFCSTLTPN